MKALSLSCVAAFALAFGTLTMAGSAAAGDAMDPRGLWLRPEGGVQFSFYDCGAGLLCAKVVDAKSAEDKAGIGTVILRGAKKVAANEWRGTLFNSDDGKSYDGHISVKSNGAQLSVKGCVMSVLCGGETWTRISQGAKAPAGSVAAAQ